MDYILLEKYDLVPPYFVSVKEIWFGTTEDYISEIWLGNIIL